MTTVATAVQQVCRQMPVQLLRQSSAELHFVIQDDEDWLHLAQWANRTGCDVCSFFASDERALEANAFKLYLLLSAPDGSLIILERAAAGPGRPSGYLSVREVFPNVERWEREIAELFGLMPYNLPLPVPERAMLVGPYPADLYPLRRTVALAELRETLTATQLAESPRSYRLSEGLQDLWAGPIHAGIKEAGPLRLLIAGETVEGLQLDPGYKHRGLEKLFEAQRLEDGWRLAEVIAGDASFAHSLAYCQAVESLANVVVPPLAQVWRATLLEMERIANHIGNIASLVHDIALPLVAAPLSCLREEVLRLNAGLTGSRLLRGVNRPGGVALQPALSGKELASRLEGIIGRCVALGQAVIESPSCRDRLIATGVLSLDEARRCGASGIIRRASNDVTFDFRLRHPFGVYSRPEIRAEIQATFTGPVGKETTEGDLSPRHGRVQSADLNGDVFARLVLRVAEIETAARIIAHLAAELEAPKTPNASLTPITAALADAEPYALGLGYVEGARGAIIHCGMKGPGQRPHRWKYSDPSEAALCALSVAASYRANADRSAPARGDIVADIPLDNISMDASLAACAG